MSELPSAPIEDRIRSRIAFQEMKRQANIEAITNQAAEELGDDEDVPSQSPDEDWIARFFRISEEISTEYMQMLWGKLLAGEIRRPGSYSLRTLDILKNITQKEAELFVKVSNFVVETIEADAFIIKPGNKYSYIESHFGINYGDILLLQEIDLVYSAENLAVTVFKANKEDVLLFQIGQTGLIIERPEDSSNITIPSVTITRSGVQILELIEKKPCDIEYVKKFASYFNRQNTKIFFAEVSKSYNNGNKEVQFKKGEELIL